MVEKFNQPNNDNRSSNNRSEYLCENSASQCLLKNPNTNNNSNLFRLTSNDIKHNISVDFFYQYRKLDTEIGEFGFHNQANTWKS
jgi:hypothetical protein